jgi:hypothetical protein
MMAPDQGHKVVMQCHHKIWVRIGSALASRVRCCYMNFIILDLGCSPVEFVVAINRPLPRAPCGDLVGGAQWYLWDSFISSSDLSYYSRSGEGPHPSRTRCSPRVLLQADVLRLRRLILRLGHRRRLRGHFDAWVALPIGQPQPG